ncbi:hypothetical protein [Acinetobacter colistiniresistens]|uniref:hypothetical protein n=1 Tax=Acinetobacter colistiniresistens TaxID=280145 RepID=UPI001250AE83|nr:hypothetical protein [Acinetobacter colistiniresistens]
MRSEFEKLEEIKNLFKIGNFQFNEDEGNYTGTKGTALSYLRGAWVIYQSRQTEVDELNWQLESEREETIKGYTKISDLRLERDELQYKAKLRESDHQALLVKYQATKKCWEDMGKEKDELKKRVDAAHDTLTDLKDKSEALHHRWNILSDSVALAEAEMIDMCVKELEQALKGGGE